MLLNYAGREFLEDPRLNLFHRIYIWLFGVPISGLRIRLRRILPEISGSFQSAIDLGCGTGVFAFELARRHPRSRITGVDIDDKQIAVNNSLAATHGLANVRFDKKNILEMDYVEQFDLALSVDNLEHIENDVDVLRRIHRSLKPGGKFICHVPAAKRIWIFRKMSQNFDVEGHVRPGYQLDDLKEKLLAAGFQIEELKYTYGYLETITNNISYLITKARKENQLLYAFIFPALNIVAWLGRRQDPKGRGAGVLAKARKTSDSPHVRC